MESKKLAAELGIGCWIWTTNFADNQTCRLWREFTIPAGQKANKANLRITADDYYVCYLDGREIGRGGDWENLTDYDVTWLLVPGKHVLAVEAVNVSYEGGVILGLRIQFPHGDPIAIFSDASWQVVPSLAKNWLTQTSLGKNWIPAREIGVVGQFPWWEHPATISAPSPLRPVHLDFWQTGWFITAMLSFCGAALVLSLVLGMKVSMQNRARQMVAQERVRIARDMHDDLGSVLTQLVLQGEVAQTEVAEGSPVRKRLNLLCEKARTASQTLDEVIWTVNAQRDTLQDLASYLCKYAQNYLASTHIRCRLDVQADLPFNVFDLPVRRGLLLAVKEALNNAVKYSNASELILWIHQRSDQLVIIVEDNGQGFEPAALSGERNGFINQRQRMHDLGGSFRFSSRPGQGCRVEFALPLTLSAKTPKFWWRLRPRRNSPGMPMTKHQNGSGSKLASRS